MKNSIDCNTIKSYVHFLGRDDIYDKEKPYTMRYPPDDDIPQSNFIHDKRTIYVRNMREGGPYELNDCGFQCIDFPSAMTYEDFWQHEKVQEKYLAEVKSVLGKELGAKYVYVLDYALRKRERTFPVSTGEEYQYDQPTSMAHVDFTVREGERIIRVLFGDRADEVLAGHWQFVNIWKPIKGPLNDWPLAIVDARTVDWEHDIAPSDVVFEDFVTENIQMHYNPNHKWYYLPNHEVSEALIFKSADGAHSTAPAAPHSAFPNPLSEPDDMRESLDCRCIVFFADLAKYPPVVGHFHEEHKLR